MNLREILDEIKVPDASVMEKAQQALDNLTKPLGSLGRLETIVKRIAGIRGELLPSVDKKCIIIMCADNGVVAKGVSSCPKEVTHTVTVNFTKGITGVNILSKHSGSDLHVVDVGVDADIDEPGIVNRKIRRGTWDITEGPAMTREEALTAIDAGIEAVRELKEKGYDLLGTGEMGIGNTTTSSAVVAAITGDDIEELVGRGSGLTSDAYNHKKEMVRKALEINSPDPSDGIDVLAKVGGFDIAGLAGCFIGAACYRLPILMDGFISGAAALAAVLIEPKVKEYIFPSHGSAEPGTGNIFRALGMRPMLDLDMRLGEGTGAALGFHIIDAAVTAYREMGTFGDAKIEKYVPLE